VKTERKISVVIPTRNRKELLNNALNSVYSQTYSNLEIIIVDEKSDDGTQEFLENEASLGKIITIRNENLKGAGHARNLGIKKATGEFIAFLDDDDEWLPNKLEKQIACFSDPEVGLSYTGAWLVNVDQGIQYQVIPTLDGHVFSDLLIENKIGTTNTVMLRADVAKEMLFDESLVARQDYDLWLRVAQKYKIKGIQEPLVRVFGRKKLKRITSDVKNYELAIQVINEKFKNEISSLPLETQVKREAEQLFFLGSQALKAQNIKLARSYFYKSCRRKTQIKSLGSFIASFFGEKAVLNLRRLKK